MKSRLFASFGLVLAPFIGALFACSSATPSDGGTGSAEQDEISDVKQLVACPSGGTATCPAGSFTATCKDGTLQVVTFSQVLANNVCNGPPPTPTTAPTTTATTPPSTPHCTGSYTMGPTWNQSTGQGWWQCTSPNGQTGSCSCAGGCIASGPALNADPWPSEAPARFVCEDGPPGLPPSGPAACIGAGHCIADGECCSYSCNTFGGYCQASPGCTAQGTSCSSGDHCCSGMCSGSTCL